MMYDGDGPKAYAVLKALEMFGKIHGKKALQKILYFVNLERRIFPYQWNSYGPYSEEAKYMSEDMIMNNQISVEPVQLATPGRIQFNMELAGEGRTRLASLGAMPELDSRIGLVHRLLANKDPRAMELLASVHYIASYENGRYSDRIFDIIAELKPDANFHQGDVDGAVRELQAAGMLSR